MTLMTHIFLNEIAKKKRVTNVIKQAISKNLLKRSLKFSTILIFNKMEILKFSNS